MRPAIAVLALLAVAPGCRSDRNKAASQPVVRLIPVDKKQDLPQVNISEADYRLELARLRLEREGGLNAGPLNTELKHGILNNLIERKILKMEAQRLNIRVSTAAVTRELGVMQKKIGEAQLKKALVDTFQTGTDLREVVEDRLLIGRLLGQEAHRGVEVPEEAIKKAWDNLSVTERIRPARVHASQIVVPTEEEGSALVKKLLDRQDFAALARKHSVGPEAIKGGDLGWFEMGVMPKVFDDVCFTLKPGDVSTLTPSGYGFHIFKIHEFEAARELTYEEGKEKIRTKLLQDKLQQAEAQYLHKLREKYRIERDERLLATIE